jgi:hypothetical protein
MMKADCEPSARSLKNARRLCLRAGKTVSNRRSALSPFPFKGKAGMGMVVHSLAPSVLETRQLLRRRRSSACGITIPTQTVPALPGVLHRTIFRPYRAFFTAQAVTGSL